MQHRQHIMNIAAIMAAARVNCSAVLVFLSSLRWRLKSGLW